MQVIACQMDIVWEDKLANYEKVQRLLDRFNQSNGIKPGAMIVLPEMFATGFSMNVDTAAEDETRATEKVIEELAASYGACVIGGISRVVGVSEVNGSNEAVVIARAMDGDPSTSPVSGAGDNNSIELTRYRKMQPFTHGDEDKHYLPGDSPVVFDWQGMKISPFICYDLRFPEHFRSAVRMGAEVFAIIANWPAKRAAHWKALLCARAIENQAYVIGVNRCGSDPALDYAGESLIIDPMGNLLVQAGGDEVAIEASVNIDLLREYREKFPVLKDMR